MIARIQIVGFYILNLQMYRIISRGKPKTYSMFEIADWYILIECTEDSLIRESGSKVHHANIQASKVSLSSITAVLL